MVLAHEVLARERLARRKAGLRFARRERSAQYVLNIWRPREH
jgi:hypothetical protein